MKGFEIHINDKLVCAAGLPDDAYLALGAYKHQHEGMRLYVNGTVQVSEYRLDHYDWGRQPLSVGDKIVIRVVDLEKFDKPLEKHSSDPTQSGKNEEKMIDLMARYRVIAEMEGADALKQPVSEGVFCSFCGKSNVEQPKMIAGPGKIFICIECVSRCNDILIAGGTWPRE